MSAKKFNSNYFGSYTQVTIMVRDILKRKHQKVENLRKYCATLSTDWAYSFAGILELLSFLSWVTINDDGQIWINSTGTTIRNLSDAELKSKLILSLFNKIIDEEIIQEFLGNVEYKYDLVDTTVSLSINRIPLDYSCLRNFMIDIGFFKSKDANTLLIDHNYLEFFEKKIVPIINGSITDELNKRILKNTKISIEQLKRLLAIQEELGEEAEKFVLDLEQRRLKNHPNTERIKIISKIDSSAGYDIISFSNSNSIINDKFIEVKSYSNRKGFYWSSNEVSTAQLKQDQYYLYLVDRKLMNDADYSPRIIQNPYQNVFMNSEWVRETDNWFIYIL